MWTRINSLPASRVQPYAYILYGRFLDAAADAARHWRSACWRGLVTLGLAVRHSAWIGSGITGITDEREQRTDSGGTPSQTHPQSSLKFKNLLYSIVTSVWPHDVFSQENPNKRKKEDWGHPFRAPTWTHAIASIRSWVRDLVGKSVRCPKEGRHPQRGGICSFVNTCCIQTLRLKSAWYSCERSASLISFILDLTIAGAGGPCSSEWMVLRS